MLRNYNIRLFISTMILAFIAGIFLLVPTAYAIQKSQSFLVHEINYEHGLPNNKVNAIISDKYGFMWFGTNDGLCRYDGWNIKNYPLDNQKGLDSRTPQISAIKKDKKGDIYIGSYTLFRYCYLTDKVVLCDTLSNQRIGIAPDRVRAIDFDQENTIWLGASNGLFAYFPDKDSLAHYPIKGDLKQDIASMFFNDGKLWIGTQNYGILLFDTKQKTFEYAEGLNIPINRAHLALCFYKDIEDNIWIGTELQGIFKFSLKTHATSQFFPDAKNETSYRVRRIITDNEGRIWIGTRSGIYLMNTPNSIPLHVVHEYHPVSRISSNSIYDIFIDDTQNLWIGTYSGGVAYINLQRKPFNLYFPAEKKLFKQTCSVNCFAECRNDKVWIGTEDDGLFLFDKATGQFTPYIAGNSPLNISNNTIKSLACCPDGSVWIGTYNGGLNYFNAKTGKFEKHTKGEASKLSSNIVRSLLIDKQNNLWIATDAGIDIMRNNSKTFEKLVAGQEVLALHLDRNQTIWALVSGSGLWRYDNAKEELVRVYDKALYTTLICMLIDSNNNIWVGNKKGLYHINTKTDSIQTYGIEDGLPSLLVQGIMEDNQKNLWISTDAGFIQCENAVNAPQRLFVKYYSVRDGLQGMQFIENACMYGTDNQMYFGGKYGFNMFNPSEICDNQVAPKLAFTGIRIFNEPVEIGEKVEGRVVLPESMNESKHLHLSQKHSMVTIEFAALDYSNPDKVQFRYKLSPVDKKWNYSAGNRNFVTYSNLKGGRYSFILEGSNSDGVWNKESLSLKIDVHPPFYKTLWFNFLIALLTIGIVASYIVYRYRLLAKYNQQLERNVSERTAELESNLQILQEKQQYIEQQTEQLTQQKEQLLEANQMKDKFITIMAHDLKNPFQTILAFSKMLFEEYDRFDEYHRKRYLQEINNASNNVFNLLENLLTWSRSHTGKISYYPEPIEMSRLLESVTDLLSTNLLTKGITIKQTITTGKMAYADKNMVDTVIRNLLSNAIKFSHPGSIIEIALFEANQMIQLKIKDNGIGMKTQMLENLFKIDENTNRKGTSGEEGTGLGLIICKEFIEKNSGTIHAESETGKGSSFTISLPLANLVQIASKAN
jgi:signal transduction histidine kinase/ligand-binding sensor domain-containing protein